MLDEFLREIVGIIVGKGVEPVADLLNSNRYVNEFNIAKKLGITINQTRNILYKISDYGLVLSERQKDKKKGWYTYYWKFDILKCLEFLRGKVLERKVQFETQIKRREEKTYYVCEFCNIECSEDEALLQEFTCDECGELFTQKDNSVLLKGLRKNAERLQEKIDLIDLEIEKEKKKLTRKKQAHFKKLQKEAEEKKEAAKLKRAQKRAEKKKEKEEADRKAGKVVKKKTTKKKAVKKVIKKTVVKSKASKGSKKKVAKKKTPVKKKIVKKSIPKVKKSKKKVVKKKVSKKKSSKK